ncbi:MAG: hypothetical protein ACRDRG_18355 [Pseudonocardiaceae bacterium]
MKQTTKAAARTALRRPLAVLVTVAGLAIAGCATNETPGAPSLAPPLPEVVSPPAQPQPAALDWARSMCQALDPAFDHLDVPPQPDLANPVATRQAYLDYLGNARNAAQQAIDRISVIGAPPVDNGQQVLDTMRNQLIQLREDLDDALSHLTRADPNDASAMGLALAAVAGNVLGAIGNRIQVLGTLATDRQLRAAVDQTPECQNLGANSTTGGP